MFTVVAGKYEADGERNYKYIENFATRQEAEEALARVKGYPFSELEVDPAALLQESLDRAMEPGCPGQGCQDQGRCQRAEGHAARAI